MFKIFRGFHSLSCYLNLSSRLIYLIIITLKCSILQIQAAEENFEQSGVHHYKYKNYIFDLTDVLLFVNKNAVQEEQNILGVELSDISSNVGWKNLSKGLVGREEAYLRISNDTGYSVQSVTKLISTLKNTLIPNEDMLGLLHTLKSMEKNLYCLTNVPKEDVTDLRRNHGFFDNFDAIFSGFEGMNKPDFDIYKYVLWFCNLNPEETLFIDDNESNIKAAKELGIEGILFHKSAGEISDHIKKIIILSNETRQEGCCTPLTIHSNDRVSRAYNYLIKNVDEFGLYETVMGKDVDLKDVKKLPYPDIFTQALILHLNKPLAFHKIGDEILKLISSKLSSDGDGLSCFTLDPSFPYDVDTTSIILSLLYEYGLADISIVNKAANRILSNVSEEGIILTYFDTNKIRSCAISCTNALYLIYLANCEDDLIIRKNKDFVMNYIINDEGNLYYNSRDFGLYFVTVLALKFPRHFEGYNIREILTQQVKNRISTTETTIDLASRIIICDLLGIPNEYDYIKLLSLQLEDGSWPQDYIYQATSKSKLFGVGMKFANKSLSTALAIKALESRWKANASINNK